MPLARLLANSWGGGLGAGLGLGLLGLGVRGYELGFGVWGGGRGRAAVRVRLPQRVMVAIAESTVAKGTHAKTNPSRQLNPGQPMGAGCPWSPSPPKCVLRAHPPC